MLFRGNFNDNSFAALREKKGSLLIMSTLKDFCHNFFWNDLSSQRRETHCKLVFIAWLLPGLMRNVTFVNNVICACRKRLRLPSLLQYLPFVSPFLRSLEDQERGKRIGLNSRHCPCEELTRRKSRCRHNSKVIRSVTLNWTSIIRCRLIVYHSRECVWLWNF